MLNHIELQGRLTGAPELRKTNDGKSVATFTLAVDRDFSKEKKADFVTCVAWEKKADFVSGYFDKGQEAVVAGRLQSRQYKDKEEKPRTAWEVMVENIYFSGKKVDRAETPERPKYQEPPFTDLGGDDGTLPF